MAHTCSGCGECGSEGGPASHFPVVHAVEYQKDSIVSKTISDSDAGTLTFFAFDAGQRLSTHSAPYQAIVEVIDGEALITVGGAPYRVRSGDMILMPADVPHSLEAVQPFKMILTMIRGSKSDE
jgi:quercetin dioxygenase-like cupin family protein